MVLDEQRQATSLQCELFWSRTKQLRKWRILPRGWLQAKSNSIQRHFLLHQSPQIHLWTDWCSRVNSPLHLRFSVQSEKNKIKLFFWKILLWTWDLTEFVLVNFLNFLMTRKRLVKIIENWRSQWDLLQLCHTNKSELRKKKKSEAEGLELLLESLQELWKESAGLGELVFTRWTFADSAPDLNSLGRAGRDDVNFEWSWKIIEN